MLFCRVSLVWCSCMHTHTCSDALCFFMRFEGINRNWVKLHQNKLSSFLSARSRWWISAPASVWSLQSSTSVFVMIFSRNAPLYITAPCFPTYIEKLLFPHIFCHAYVHACLCTSECVFHTLQRDIILQATRLYITPTLCSFVCLWEIHTHMHALSHTHTHALHFHPVFCF